MCCSVRFFSIVRINQVLRLFCFSIFRRLRTFNVSCNYWLQKDLFLVYKRKVKLNDNSFACKVFFFVIRKQLDISYISRIHLTEKYAELLFNVLCRAIYLNLSSSSFSTYIKAKRHHLWAYNVSIICLDNWRQRKWSWKVGDFYFFKNIRHFIKGENQDDGQCLVFKIFFLVVKN